MKRSFFSCLLVVSSACVACREPDAPRAPGGDAPIELPEASAVSASSAPASGASAVRASARVESAPSWIRVAEVKPGRYAFVARSSSMGGCSESSFASNYASSVVLDLGPGGRASACRGRHWQSIMTSNDGTGSPDDTGIMEQQGLRGTYVRRGEWLDIDLALDDTVCPRISGADPIPPPSRSRSLGAVNVPWKLSCIGVEPTGDGSMPQLGPTVPIVACQLHGAAYPNGVAYALDVPYDFFPTTEPDVGWLYLGAGNGIVIEEQAYGGMRPDPIRKLALARAPIRADEWSQKPQP